jgi:hypothetical protein
MGRLMISGLRIKRHKNGEIAALFTPGRAPYGAKRGRWRRRRRYLKTGRCLALAHVLLLMEADERTRYEEEL